MHLDTNINLNDNGLEDMDQFWNTAKTPKAVQKNAPTAMKRQPLKQENRKLKQIERQKRTPRFSLDGNAEGDSVGANIERFRSKLEVGAISPGDLSVVSTAPPTPKSPEETPEKTPEKARAAVGDLDDPIVANHAMSKSPMVGIETMQISPSAPEDDFQMDDDGDDDDDLLPPPPPDDMQPLEDPNNVSQINVDFPQDTSFTTTRSPEVQEEAPSPDEQSKTSHDDDHDNEGPGFDMNVNSPVAESNGSTTSTEPTPLPLLEKKKRGRPSKNNTDDVPAKTPVAPKGRKKQKQMTMFSPPGYPVGHREMNPVPVSDYKESPEKGKRRSRRMHVKPLAYWKNERVVYGPHSEDGKLGDEMGCMPVPMSVLTALPTPRKQRKPVTYQPDTKRGRPARPVDVVEPERPFDDSRLRKKHNFIDGEYAQIWDEALEDASNESKLLMLVLVTTRVFLSNFCAYHYRGCVVC